MDFQQTTPIYMQIADYVCEHLLSNKWQAGERILSVRELGALLEVNPNTVLRAYDFLQNKEIVLNKRGVGYSAAEDANEKIIAIRKERFFNQEMPMLFNTMQLLHIHIDELEAKYKSFIHQQHKTNNNEKENQ
ncbi:MAG: GntR family transcriptional regulator [Bacteroidales bacterium]|jgi:DNA-binding transcriptional regulator YhcF (GntR family)|nr:GntR family transcriptional regulator [Bacteroidales bacterium]